MLDVMIDHLCDGLEPSDLLTDQAHIILAVLQPRVEVDINLSAVVTTSRMYR